MVLTQTLIGLVKFESKVKYCGQPRLNLPSNSLYFTMHKESFSVCKFKLSSLFKLKKSRLQFVLHQTHSHLFNNALQGCEASTLEDCFSSSRTAHTQQKKHSLMGVYA